MTTMKLSPKRHESCVPTFSYRLAIRDDPDALFHRDSYGVSLLVETPRGAARVGTAPRERAVLPG